MRNVIERVLEEEEKAKKRIEETRQRLAAVRSRADEEADSILVQTRSQAASLLKDRVEKARAVARDLESRAAGEEESRNRSLYEGAHAKIPALAAEIAASILSTDLGKD